MKILVTHLTRMKLDHICIAGLDIANGKHVRPIKNPTFIRADLIAGIGCVDLGRLLELKFPEARSAAPEVEDVLCTRLLPAGEVTSEAFWQRLEAANQPDLVTAFGADLIEYATSDGPTLTLRPGTGLASLAVFSPDVQPTLRLKENGDRSSIRLSCLIGGTRLDLPVTDLRLHREDGSPDLSQIEKLGALLAEGNKSLLCLGFGRAFKGRNQVDAVHWLQVNNIHMQSDPLWTHEVPLP